MRISDWSSDVCSSDLPPPDRAAGAAPIVITGTMGAADRMSRSFRWPSACRGTVLLPLDMQAMLAPGDEQAARHDQRRADPRRLGGEGRSEEHTSELQSLIRISYAVFCLEKQTDDTRT